MRGEGVQGSLLGVLPHIYLVDVSLHNPGRMAVELRGVCLVLRLVNAARAEKE